MIVQFALDAGEKSVGEAFGLYVQKGLPGRHNNSISAGERMPKAPERIVQNPLRFCPQNKFPLSVAEPTIDPRLAFAGWHDIRKKIEIVFRIRIPDEETGRKNLIHQVVVMGTDQAFTGF